MTEDERRRIYPKGCDPKYHVYHIPLRVRKWNDPCGGDDWLRWIRTHSPVPPFQQGRGKPTWAPTGDYIPPEKHSWLVESYDWWVPVEEGMPLLWRPFAKFKTKDEALDFCRAWRDDEARNEAADAAWRKGL